MRGRRRKRFLVRADRTVDLLLQILKQTGCRLSQRARNNEFVRLTAADPGVPLSIDPNYFAHADDMAAMIRAVRITRHAISPRLAIRMRSNIVEIGRAHV